MTGSNVFLDSNIVIEVFSGNKGLADKIDKLPIFYISSIVLSELSVGINRDANKAKHLDKLISFLDLCTALAVDSTTAQFFGEITVGLYKKGKPIPTNDVWIAASVKQHNFTLISRDKHFKEIDDIDIETW